MKKKRYFWVTKDEQPTSNLKLVWYIFDNLFPNFHARREMVTSEMNKQVTEMYNYLTDDNLRKGQMWYPVRFSYSVRLDSVDAAQYDLYDQMIIKYKK